MLPREDYPMVINTELEQLEFELENLRRKLEQSGDEAKSEYSELIDVMENKLNQARKKLKALEKASDDQWDEIKADLDNTRNALKSMLSNTMSQVT